jgi:thiol-disulfide isomerase/thioredoxin
MHSLQKMKSAFTVVLFFLLEICQAQKKSTTVIGIPASIDGSKIVVWYDDGKTIQTIPVTFNNYKASVSGTFYSKYAMLSVEYPRTENSRHNNSFFIKEGHSSIAFSECRNGDSLAYPFDSCVLKNAIEIRKLPEANFFYSFTQKESSELNECINKFVKNEDDSLRQMMVIKSDLLVKKQIEYVKQNNNTWYSLWLFMHHFLGFDCIQKNYDTLSKIFASFPTALKNSFEGREVLKKMNGAMSTKKGFRAPTFIAKDILGKTIDLSNYRGKYVLMQFWASWCGPCIEEIPTIEKIRDSYGPDKLEVISITIDKDSLAFDKEMRKHKMNWTNILDNKHEIYALYGGKPIPSIYLIDKNGMIVFSSWEDHFDALNKLLSQSIN